MYPITSIRTLVGATPKQSLMVLAVAPVAKANTRKQIWFNSKRVKNQQLDGKLMELIAAASTAETYGFIFIYFLTNLHVCCQVMQASARRAQKWSRGPRLTLGRNVEFRLSLFTPKYHCPPPSPPLSRWLSSALLSEHVWRVETWGGKDDEGSAILMLSAAAGSHFSGKSKVVAWGKKSFGFVKSDMIWLCVHQWEEVLLVAVGCGVQP